MNIVDCVIFSPDNILPIGSSLDVGWKEILNTREIVWLYMYMETLEHLTLINPDPH